MKKNWLKTPSKSNKKWLIFSFMFNEGKKILSLSIISYNTVTVSLKTEVVIKIFEFKIKASLLRFNFFQITPGLTSRRHIAFLFNFSKMSCLQVFWVLAALITFQM